MLVLIICLNSRRRASFVVAASVQRYYFRNYNQNILPLPLRQTFFLCFRAYSLSTGFLWKRRLYWRLCPPASSIEHM